jgi:Protein of unknown function (DUF1566)
MERYTLRGCRAALVAGCGVLLLAATAAQAGVTAAAKCEAQKNQEAGKYAYCLEKAQTKLVKTKGTCSDSTVCYQDTDCSSGSCTKDMTKYNDLVGKCDTKFSADWSKWETKAGGSCPTTGDEAAVQSFVEAHTSVVGSALGGGTLPEDVATCNADLTTCNGSYSTCSSTLSSCNTNYTSCTGSLNTCNSDLGTCQSNLTTAQACGNGVIDTGEQCDQGNLNGKTCATQGFAGGTLACGADCTFDTTGCSVVRFVDNGDGRVTDTQTGLMWEKKTTAVGSGPNYADPHDVDNYYSWSSTGTAPDGTAFTEFLGALNNGTSSDGTTTTGCFANHCDWRLPTVEELAGIMDPAAAGCGSGSPCIDPAFGPT